MKTVLVPARQFSPAIEERESPPKKLANPFSGAVVPTRFFMLLYPSRGLCTGLVLLTGHAEVMSEA